MQSMHELEKRAEVHRLEALKKIKAISESTLEEQALGREAPTSDDRTIEAGGWSVAASHQHA